MKWYKAILVAVPVFFGTAALTVLPTKVASAMHYYSWRDFWKRLGDILLDLFEIYAKQAIVRGYLRVGVNSAPIVTLFQGNPQDAETAMQNGIGLDGETLVVRQDIVIYSDGANGVALKQGEYKIDSEGNFQFDLIRVPKPVPSPTFPLPRPTQL